MDDRNLRPLPRGWVWTSLTDVHVDKSHSVAPNSAPSQMFELYSVPSYDARKPEILAGKEIGSNKRTVEEGTVLLCKINPRINRVWIVGSSSRWVKVASTEWIPFFQRDEVSSKYLYHFLQNSSFRSFLASNVSGVGGSLMRANVRVIDSYSFPLPPLPEQRRIVARIEELFTRLDAGIVALNKIKTQLKRYRQSVLKAAFEGKLTAEWREAHKGESEPASVLLEKIKAERAKSGKYKELPPMDTSGLPELPEGWVWTKVGELAHVGTGATPLRSNQRYYEGGTIPWVTSAALNAPFVTNANEMITDLAVKETNAKVFPIHALLLAMYGEGKTRGKVSELRIEAATNQACAAIVFEGHAVALRPLVKTYLQRNYDEIRQQSSGGVQPNLNLGLVKAAWVPIPIVGEEQKIMEEIERHFSVADEVEKTVEQGLKQAERLRQSILKTAFEGKLVPQDPNDEPAEKLLERIKASRAGANTSRSARKRS